MPVAFVLSGGGAKGDFEVGAIRYLYEQGIRPDIICGCSVGAINGAKLAEGEGGPNQGLSGLEAIWLSLSVNSDMYQEEPWLSRIDKRIRSVLLDEPGDRIDGPDTKFPEWGMLEKIAEGISLALWADDAVAVLTALKEMKEATSLFSLAPIEWRLRGNPNAGFERQLDPGHIAAWSAGGAQKLRLATVSLETGALRYVTETGALLERDNTRSVLGPREECREIIHQIEALQEELNSLSADFVGAPNKAVVAKQVKDLTRRINEMRRDLATCMALPGDPVTTDIVSGILASSSIAGVFKPVRLGGEWYIDGGFRTVLPMEAALSLGADTIYGVVASKSGADRHAPYGGKKLPELVARGLVDISIDEHLERDLHPPTGWGKGRNVRIIQPTLSPDLHGTTTVDTGLIRIAMAYGYMRAADVHRNIPTRSRAWELCDEIISLRKEIWRLECIFEGKVIPTETRRGARPPEPAQQDQILSRKEKLAHLIVERYNMGGVLPSDANRWHLDAMQWPRRPEEHPWPSSLNVAAPAGNWPALTQQHILDIRLDQQGWAVADVSILVRNTPPSPAAAGNLATYVTPDGVGRVLYADWQGQVQEIRLDREGWAQANLSALVRNPPAASSSISGPAPFVTPDGVWRAIYVGWDRRVHEIRLDQEGWAQADLSAIVQNEPPSPPAVGRPSAIVNADGVPRVFYRGLDDGHIHELRLEGHGWMHADVSSIVRNQPPALAAATDPAVYISPDQVLRVVYVGLDRRVHEIRLDGEGWAHADLSALVRNEPPAPAASLDQPAVLVGPDGVARVFYRGQTDAHIYEIHLDHDGWARARLADLVRNPPATPAAGAPIAYVSHDGVVRVVYRGKADHQIHEIRLDRDGWAQANLSAIVRNPPCAPANGSGLAAFVTPDGVSRVMYVS
jgi:predicted acylesterase/phospholipase RssA